MTLKSKAPIMLVASGRKVELLLDLLDLLRALATPHDGPDESGHGDAALEPAHQVDGDEIDDDVDHGCRSERLENLKRELLHRARRCGEVKQPDLQRVGGVLHQV